MRNWRLITIVIILMALLDVFIFQAIKTVSQNASASSKQLIFSAYWGISLSTLIIFALLPLLNARKWPKLRTYLFTTVLGFFFAKILASVFFLIDDTRRLIQWTIGKLSSHPGVGRGAAADGISRSPFLSWLGLGVGGALFSSLVYGFSNKYNYEVRRVRLAFDNLPPAFKGLKIVQLSDIHSGSLHNKKAVEKGIDKILNERPDLILFTGDLVNDIAAELKDYTGVFGCLKAPLGVFSTLGNHDYGDYAWWGTPEEKVANLEHLKQMQRDMGWRLLMNEHVALEKGGQQIALLGIENWSAKARFPKY